MTGDTTSPEVQKAERELIELYEEQKGELGHEPWPYTELKKLISAFHQSNETISRLQTDLDTAKTALLESQEEVITARFTIAEQSKRFTELEKRLIIRDVTCDELMTALNASDKRNLSLEQRANKLARFARHADNCDFPLSQIQLHPKPCSCGLSELLKG